MSSLLEIMGHHAVEMPHSESSLAGCFRRAFANGTLNGEVVQSGIVLFPRDPDKVRSNVLGAANHANRLQ